MCVPLINRTSQSGEFDGDNTVKIEEHSPQECEQGKTLADIGGHVLFVDDSPIPRAVFLRCLKNLNYKGRVTIAENGNEAVKEYLYHRDTITIIFMDILMPEKDGLSATKEIRRAEGNERHIPIICISSDSKEKESEWREAGMDAGIGKVFGNDDIWSVFKEYQTCKEF